MASSPEKVQLDPEASNNKKPPVGGLTALLETQGRLDSCEDRPALLELMCAQAHTANNSLTSGK